MGPIVGRIVTSPAAGQGRSFYLRLLDVARFGTPQ
jgi:hypothetical protein